MQKKPDITFSDCDKTLKYYSGNAHHLSTRYESADVSDLLKSLNNCFKNHRAILELGCGSGRDAAFMMSRGYDITALDGSEQMIQSAVKLHPELLNHTLVATLPEGLFKLDRTFDGIYSIATMMHLREPQVRQTLQRISELLNPGGVLFFSVSIFRDDIDEKGFDAKGRFFLSMSEDEWVSLCIDSGFVLKSAIQTGDGLGRDGISWLSCVVVKGV